MVDDDKLWSSYASWGIDDTKSSISCFLFYIWVLFVVLQVCVFNVCSSMEWLGWVDFGDGVDSSLLCLWGMWIMTLSDGWSDCF